MSQLKILVMFLLAVAAVPVLAREDFFTARIAIDDRSEAALDQAARDALSQVLIRVSGDEQVVTLPRIANALESARDAMSLYAYEERDGQTVLVAEFDASAVKNLLRKAGATYWSESRPPVLLWLVLDEPYSRRFATVSEDETLLKELAAQFAERGVELRLPLLDLQDAAALSPEMLWQKVLPRIEKASARYGTEHILVGRYVQLTNGRQLADWLYLHRDQQANRQTQGNSADAILAEAVDLVVDAMAAQYAVKLEPVTTFETLAVSIAGVASYNDYREVLAIFQRISVLDGVRVAAVDGDRLSLSVGGVGSAETLARLLPPRSRLGLGQPPQGTELHLVWGQP